jgi:hypothetical protein
MENTVVTVRRVATLVPNQMGLHASESLARLSLSQTETHMATVGIASEREQLHNWYHDRFLIRVSE